MSGPLVIYVATDVGLWMALPAFGPAFVIAGVFIFIIRRDRRCPSEPHVSKAPPSAAGGN